MQRNLTASVLTLGCKVNQCESNALKFLLQQKGYAITNEYQSADVVLLNTCAVTHEAFCKSKQMARRILAKNPNAKICILGCASQNNPQDFVLTPNVLVCGGTDKQNIVDILDKSGINFFEQQLFEKEICCDNEKTRGFVKVEDGCENFCSYCIVPHLRGKVRSATIECVKKEIESLQNCAEIVLVGINLSAYGKDLGSSLIELCESINSQNFRFRFGSLEPIVITDDFLKRLCKLNVCPHFHLSLQSGSNSVLQAMNRRYSREEFLNCCKKIREYFPQCSVTTDVIVGFPTESEEDFLQTYDLCQKAEFLDMHIFPYSPRKGTVASKMKLLPTDVVADRVKRLTALKKQLNKESTQKYVGKNLKVIFEEFDEKTQSFVGHSREFIKVFSKEDVPINKEIDFLYKGVTENE